MCYFGGMQGGIDHQIINATDILPGSVAKIYDYKTTLPSVNKPAQMRLYITLSGNGVFAVNANDITARTSSS